ncbi:hypothetical protein AB4571_01765 [Vibrio breoganii]|uniref:hypothetical protein n=1 Tax=Vibrio breoganii TaxID=553239 RepID=UPI000C85C3B8|nr:hypothetical protein [Vibrio breoganii]PML19620.1 hypothetical protein BCT84_18265 [Vibrio breoganii]
MLRTLALPISLMAAFYADASYQDAISGVDSGFTKVSQDAFADIAGKNPYYHFSEAARAGRVDVAVRAERVSSTSRSTNADRGGYAVNAGSAGNVSSISASLRNSIIAEARAGMSSVTVRSCTWRSIGSQCKQYGNSDDNPRYAAGDKTTYVHVNGSDVFRPTEQYTLKGSICGGGSGPPSYFYSTIACM